MRQTSEWMIALDGQGHITKAAFSLTSNVPKGEVHRTDITEPNRDIIVHWYGHKPYTQLEQAITVFITDWLSDGRLG